MVDFSRDIDIGTDAGTEGVELERIRLGLSILVDQDLEGAEEAPVEESE